MFEHQFSAAALGRVNVMHRVVEASNLTDALQRILSITGHACRHIRRKGALHVADPVKRKMLSIDTSDMNWSLMLLGDEDLAESAKFKLDETLRGNMQALRKALDLKSLEHTLDAAIVLGSELACFIDRSSGNICFQNRTGKKLAYYNILRRDSASPSPPSNNGWYLDI